MQLYRFDGLLSIYRALAKPTKLKGWWQVETQATGLNRESLYKALSKGRHPRIGTVMEVLSAMGCRIRLEPAKKARRKAA